MITSVTGFSGRDDIRFARLSATAQACRGAASIVARKRVERGTSQSGDRCGRCDCSRSGRGWTLRYSILAGPQLGHDRAEVLCLERLVLGGESEVNRGQDRALEMHVEDAFGALDRLLGQFQDLLRTFHRLSDRIS